jgi:aminopeptidase N
MFDERVYKRGALALHALRRRIGDDRFFRLLRDWAGRTRHATATTEGFTALAESHAGRSLHRVLGPWLHEAPLPPFPR